MPSRDTFKAFTDAATATIAREIAAIRRAAEDERAIQAAERRALMAELAAEKEALACARRALEDRVAGLKDGRDGADGRDGKDAQPPDIETLKAIAAELVAAIPVPKDGADGRDGRDADMSVVREMLAEMVAAIPAAKDGRDGADGKDGADGRDGKDGEPGPMGALPLVKAWEDRVYYQGEVASFDGGLFQAQRDTGKSPTHEDWLCIVRAGRDGKDGQDGKSPNHRGLYSADAVYAAADVVNLNGGAFWALKDDPGPCPGEGWTLIASQGKQGKPGPKGDRGDQGPISGCIVAIAVDADSHTLRVVNEDGSVVECDLYPLLEKVF